MPDGPATPTPLEGVTSLYRRFRPGRFVELRGQDHVVRALRGAVANGRVSHAYLFSGPRGTGKTTSARILAKALNCEEPVDGDACNACASCVAITRGSSLDVIELDAASNNGVDDVRDIVAGAWHGTPGTWKVYIVDEVHQLSKAASAALLKTLEEPPAHVVFVLATTDPHKVLPTIRSRTQHLEFRLFPAETLASLLKDVSDAADLATDVATLEAAVRLGRGSARDALSALDQLLATGAVAEARPTFDGLLEGIVRADAVSTLAALATLVGEGWDPEQLAESLAGELRQVFLLQVAPRVADAVDADRARLVDWGERLGLARTVRVLEAVGRAIREMKSAPDKVVILEVALVRLVRPELEATVEALDERLTRLERELRAPSPAAPAAPARRPIGQGVTATPPPSASGPAAAPPPDAPAPAPSVEGDGGGASGVVPTLEDVRTRFVERVVPRTSRAAQLILRSARVEALDGTVLTIAVASEEMRQNTEMITQGLRGALEHEFQRGFTIRWSVDPSLVVATPGPAPRRASTPIRDEEVHDTGDDDAQVVVVDSAAEHLITEMFPGAEEIS
ncbi:MAG TPA: DNA polymerase III subunit gamma/tau [Acidimicrobiales bacterium]|nr:DNA polymerase III subunit gamma/tau [Acidimicrobiales bacterium]